MHYKKIVTMSATANYAAVKIFPAYHKGGKNRSQKKNATSEAAIKRNKKELRKLEKMLMVVLLNLKQILVKYTIMKWHVRQLKMVKFLTLN